MKLYFAFLFAVSLGVQSFLFACKKKADPPTVCERAGGHWTYYDCNDTTTLEWIGGVCGWSAVYCEGATPIAVTRTACKQHCKFPERRPKQQAEWDGQ